MTVEVILPKWGLTMEEGTLGAWLVKPGDVVKAGQVIAEIETDKATMEVEAVDEGEVLELLVPEGAEEVPVNAVIARLKGEDEAAARAVAAPAPTSSAPAASAAPAPAPAAAPVTGVPPAGVPAPASGGRVKASPLARKVAALRGVALETLRGTGPGGRIVRADVEAAAGLVSSPGVLPAPAPAAEAAPAQPAAPAPAAVPAPLLPGAPPFETVKLSTMRKTIARRLTESKTTIPHFYLSIDCRLDALLALRTELNAALAGQGVKLSVNDFLVKALALALDPPALLITDRPEALLPLVKKLPTRVAAFDRHLLNCGGPSLGPAALRLAAIRDSLP